MIDSTPHAVRLWIAPRSARFLAIVVDLLVCGLLTWPIEVAVEAVTRDTDDLVFLIFEFLYFWLLHARYGQTIGKRLFRIMVVSPATGRPPSLRASAIRAGFFAFVPMIPVVGWFIGLLDGQHLFWDQKRRCYHDLCANTVVVNVPEKPRA
ncbi:RDD family protein [Nonomuraea sp. NPDC049709]|uniref:RDD family protein n=1 Tax=Nonomuraea sp. NPDC049709 TaxID=3154736 RepID=UPI003426F79D